MCCLRGLSCQIRIRFRKPSDSNPPKVGYRTCFTSAADLAARCRRAAIEGKWGTMMRFFAGPTLLVINELGYLPLPAEAASALFQVINQRYLKTSIVITTNRPVGAWGEILGDTTVAAAMLNRLLHRSVVITLDGASYLQTISGNQTMGHVISVPSVDEVVNLVSRGPVKVGLHPGREQRLVDAVALEQGREE